MTKTGDFSVHPGYYIKEIIEYYHLSNAEFAKKLGISENTVQSLVKGNQDISVDIALKLSELLDTSAQYWINLQKAYDIADLKKQIKQLQKENRKLWEDRAHWELENCPGCKNLVDLQDALYKIAELESKINSDGTVHTARPQYPK